MGSARWLPIRRVDFRNLSRTRCDCCVYFCLLFLMVLCCDICDCIAVSTSGAVGERCGVYTVALEVLFFVIAPTSDVSGECGDARSPRFVLFLSSSGTEDERCDSLADRRRARVSERLSSGV